jgi:hypothetical protein
MSCCPHCHCHSWGYPAYLPPLPPGSYFPAPEPPPGRAHEEPLAGLLVKVQEELATLRREVDELRPSGAGQR